MSPFLSALLLLFLLSSSVHSTSTKKYLRRTIEVKPKSNDSPNQINFQFFIQSSSSPASSQSVAEALTSFGSTLFHASAEYGDRFISFGVEPLTTSETNAVVVSAAVSRDGATRYLRGEDKEQQQSSSDASFKADLVLEKDTNVQGTNEEQVAQFFLNGLNDAAGSIDDLDSLLGEEWAAVDYDYGGETSATTSTTTTYAEEVPLAADDNDGEETAAAGEKSISVQKTTTTLLSNSKTTNIKSKNSTNPGAINPKVIAIALSVFGICFLAFLYVAYGHHLKRRKEKVIHTPNGRWKKSKLSNSLIYVPKSVRNFFLDDDEVEDGAVRSS